MNSITNFMDFWHIVSLTIKLTTYYSYIATNLSYSCNKVILLTTHAFFQVDQGGFRKNLS